MSFSSFYGGRTGAPFRIVYRFDGIDIPEINGVKPPAVCKYAVRKKGDNYYFNFPFIKQDGNNYAQHQWQLLECDGHEVEVININDVILRKPAPVKYLEGMYQCFARGGETTDKVNYGEYVIIDTIQNRDDYEHPDNGKIFRRGMAYSNLIPDADGYIHGAEFIGQVAGPKGAKGESGGIRFIGIYDQWEDIAGAPAPEVIGGDPIYKGWVALYQRNPGSTETDENKVYNLAIYNYTLNGSGSPIGWEPAGTFTNSPDQEIVTNDIQNYDQYLKKDGFVLDTGSRTSKNGSVDIIDAIVKKLDDNNNKEYRIGADQEMVSAIANSNNNNLEEQLLLGNDEFTKITKTVDSIVIDGVTYDCIKIAEERKYKVSESTNDYYILYRTIYKQAPQEYNNQLQKLVLYLNPKVYKVNEILAYYKDSKTDIAERVSNFVYNEANHSVTIRKDISPVNS